MAETVAGSVGAQGSFGECCRVLIGLSMNQGPGHNVAEQQVWFRQDGETQERYL